MESTIGLVKTYTYLAYHFPILESPNPNFTFLGHLNQLIYGSKVTI